MSEKYKHLKERMEDFVAKEGDDLLTDARKDLVEAQKNLTKTRSWLRLHRKETPVWNSPEKPTDKT